MVKTVFSKAPRVIQTDYISHVLLEFLIVKSPTGILCDFEKPKPRRSCIIVTLTYLNIWCRLQNI